jgi:hypothetical protein
MNHKSLFALILLSCMASVNAGRDVTPTIINRSQGRDAALKVAGLAEKVHLNSDEESTYANFNVNLGYAQSFRSNRIAECLFGDDLVGCNSIKIQGSEVADRNAQAWLADYFYLPTDYDASFSINPKVQTGLANLDLFVGLDGWVDGMYLRVHGPITWTKWDLKFNELCDQNFTNSHREGYFTWDGMTSDQLLETFGEYAGGKAPLNTSGFDGASLDQDSIGVAFQGLNYAKMERCSRSRTGFADLRFELGYNMLSSEDYHFGLNVQVAAPSGSRRQAEFAFDPTIGNGNHWEIGGGLTAHYMLWRCEAEDKFVGIYLDANFTHMNNAKEQRTFDLKCRPNSRYMLAEKLGTPTQLLKAGATSGTAVAPVKQFKGEYAPVANLTTVDVHVRASIQTDIALMVNYTTNNWGFDLGYDFWARSSEKISLPATPTKDCCPNLCTTPKNTWALKGDAAVFGFATDDSGTLLTGDPVALSATQCGATIHKGTNADADVADCTGVDSLQNCGVDNAQFAFGDQANSGAVPLSHNGLDVASDYVKTSLDPKFINCCDINFQRTKGISHKVFGNINYTWEMDGWSPYFGAGASGEFASKSSDDCCTDGPVCGDSCADSCCDIEDSPNSLKCALSEWRLWLQGGISFN